MDIVNTFSLDEVKVKFKGSKLAVGSSKMPSAVVDRIFMETLTPLNKSMVEGAAAFVATKKKKKADGISLTSDANHASHKRKVATRGTDVSSQLAPQGNFENSCVANGNHHINHVISNMPVMDGEDDERRDRTVGGLRPSQGTTPSTYLSSFHAVQHNRKQFTKLVEAIDPADMELTCDYDFWLWLEAQNFFAPFSYKTHDLSVLALQDIGGAAVRERWHQPPHLLPPASSTSAAASSSNSSFPPSSSSAGAVGDNSASAPLRVTESGSSGEVVAREICDHAVDNRPAGLQPLHYQQPFPDLRSGSSGGGGAVSQSVNRVGGLHPCLHSSTGGLDLGAHSDCSDCYWDSSGGSAFSFSGPSDLNNPFTTMTTSSASTASRHTTTAQGIDDPPEDIISQNKIHADIYNNNNFSSKPRHHPFAHQGPPLRTEDAHGEAPLQGPFLDDEIAELNEELLAEHRQVNILLARLRRHALQGPAARGELEETNRRTERDKTVLARWRKANSSIHHGAGGGHGSGTIGKAKSSHKKKLGTY